MLVMEIIIVETKSFAVEQQTIHIFAVPISIAISWLDFEIRICKEIVVFDIYCRELKKFHIFIFVRAKRSKLATVMPLYCRAETLR